jgi:hypothetical protein
MPHVNEWFYGPGLERTRKHLSSYVVGSAGNFDPWIAYLDKEPFALIMSSKIRQANPYKKYSKVKNCQTLDLLIGPREFLSRGLGTRVIKQFIKQHPTVEQWLIDPELTTQKAIHCYKKIGFKPIEEFIPNFNPRMHLMMSYRT